MPAARARGEDYDVALSLDALAALGPSDDGLRTERDAIRRQLGVVRLPTIPQLSAEVDRDPPLAALAH